MSEDNINTCSEEIVAFAKSLADVEAFKVHLDDCCNYLENPEKTECPYKHQDGTQFSEEETVDMLAAILDTRQEFFEDNLVANTAVTIAGATMNGALLAVIQKSGVNFFDLMMNDPEEISYDDLKSAGSSSTSDAQLPRPEDLIS